MRKTLNFFTCISHPLYLLQTLTTLNLAHSGIGHKAEQAIAQALERNQVKHKFCFFTSISHSLYSLQTLTTLNLRYNEIRTAGAQAIAQTLARNQVR